MDLLIKMHIKKPEETRFASFFGCVRVGIIASKLANSHFAFAEIIGLAAKNG